MRDSSYSFQNGQYAINHTHANMDDYHPSQTVGNDCGLHYTLLDPCNDDGVVRPWIVQFSTATEYCDIYVYSWPDLIDLLGRLSPIALAGILDEEQVFTIYRLLVRVKQDLRTK